jgi:hypothetical protein
MDTTDREVALGVHLKVSDVKLQHPRRWIVHVEHSQHCRGVDVPLDDVLRGNKHAAVAADEERRADVSKVVPTLSGFRSQGRIG